MGFTVALTSAHAAMRGHRPVGRSSCGTDRYHPGMSFDLAQVNVSRLLAPLESPQLAPFMAALDEVNAEGDAASGFLWRLQTEDGNVTGVKAFG